jgi:hypothetical protein
LFILSLTMRPVSVRLFAGVVSVMTGVPFR